MVKKYFQAFSAKKPFRVVCIGDSTTSQDWCHPNWIDWLNFTYRVTSDWENDWKRKFINCGRDGATIDHYLANFDVEVTEFNPQVVILSLGINNLLPKFNPEEYTRDLKSLIEKILKINSDILLWSPYAINNKKYHHDLKKESEICEKLSKKYNLVFIDMFSEFLRYDLNKLFTFSQDCGNPIWGIEENGLDFLHCNEIGNQIIAQQIAQKGFNCDLNDWVFASMKRVNLKNYLTK